MCAGSCHVSSGQQGALCICLARQRRGPRLPAGGFQGSARSARGIRRCPPRGEAVCPCRAHGALRFSPDAGASFSATHRDAGGPSPTQMAPASPVCRCLFPVRTQDRFPGLPALPVTALSGWRCGALKPGPCQARGPSRRCTPSARCPGTREGEGAPCVRVPRRVIGALPRALAAPLTLLRKAGTGPPLRANPQTGLLRLPCPPHLGTCSPRPAPAVRPHRAHLTCSPSAAEGSLPGSWGAPCSRRLRAPGPPSARGSLSVLPGKPPLNPNELEGSRRSSPACLTLVLANGEGSGHLPRSLRPGGQVLLRNRATSWVKGRTGAGPQDNWSSVCVVCPLCPLPLSPSRRPGSLCARVRPLFSPGG